MYCIDIHNLKKSLDKAVAEDIRDLGKPAMVYNFHHSAKNLHSLDTEQQWNEEKENFTKKGWNIRFVDKEIDIDKKKWKVKLWVIQPLKNGKVDAKKYKKATNIINDPLAMCVGYLTSGFCYLELIN